MTNEAIPYQEFGANRLLHRPMHCASNGIPCNRSGCYLPADAHSCAAVRFAVRLAIWSGLRLSSLLTGMPPAFPTLPAMMLELCAYGVLTGLFYRKLRGNLYLSLIGAMLGGRAVSGIANAVLLGIAGKPYGFTVFLTSAFVTALPGIVIQLVAVPLLVAALQKAGLVQRPRRVCMAEDA